MIQLLLKEIDTEIEPRFGDSVRSNALLEETCKVREDASASRKNSTKKKKESTVKIKCSPGSDKKSKLERFFGVDPEVTQSTEKHRSSTWRMPLRSKSLSPEQSRSKAQTLCLGSDSRGNIGSSSKVKQILGCSVPAADPRSLCKNRQGDRNAATTISVRDEKQQMKLQKFFGSQLEGEQTEKVDQFAIRGRQRSLSCASSSKSHIMVHAGRSGKAKACSAQEQPKLTGRRRSNSLSSNFHRKQKLEKFFGQAPIEQPTEVQRQADLSLKAQQILGMNATSVLNSSTINDNETLLHWTANSSSTTGMTFCQTKSPRSTTTSKVIQQEEVVLPLKLQQLLGVQYTPSESKQCLLTQDLHGGPSLKSSTYDPCNPLIGKNMAMESHREPPRMQQSKKLHKILGLDTLQSLPPVASTHKRRSLSVDLSSLSLQELSSARHKGNPATSMTSSLAARRRSRSLNCKNLQITEFSSLPHSKTTSPTRASPAISTNARNETTASSSSSNEAAHFLSLHRTSHQPQGRTSHQSSSAHSSHSHMNQVDVSGKGISRATRTSAKLSRFFGTPIT